MGAMKVEFINPFVAATLHVFETMFATKLTRGSVFLRKTDETHGGLSGVIGLSGRAIGTVALIVNNQTAVKITERFLSMEIDEVDEEVVDCMGEVVNMISSNAKAELGEYELSLSLPTIVRGDDHPIEFPKDVTPLCVPFTSDVGDMMLQIGFIMQDEM